MRCDEIEVKLDGQAFTDIPKWSKQKKTRNKLKNGNIKREWNDSLIVFEMHWQSMWKTATASIDGLNYRWKMK